MIKISKRNLTQCFDDSMSSFSSGKRIKLVNLIYTVRDVIHKEEEAILEHTIRLNTRKAIYLNISLFTCTLLCLITSHGIY